MAVGGNLELPQKRTSTINLKTMKTMKNNKRTIAGAILSGGTGALILLTAPGFAQTNPGDAIRPFHVSFPDAALTDLRQRVLATKWPEKETVSDQSQGVQLATMQALANYWATAYDWRKCEAKLNSYPQFITNIDGLDIHFIQVKSKNPNALPIIITHGWPGSIIEQLKIIGPLTDPAAYGGKAEDSFDVIIPSLPGHGFSGKPTTTGWDPQHIARAWIVLMKRLGYKRFVAQGGDWGNAVTEQMSRSRYRHPGIDRYSAYQHARHTSGQTFQKHSSLANRPPIFGLSGDEKHAWDQLDYFYKHGLGYASEMANRPQTLYAIEDSPVGLAAWMLDHDGVSLALITRVFNGVSEGLTRQDIVDNITLYWLTGTAISSARLYWESKLPFFDPKGVTIPVAVSAFPDELYQAPKSWTEKAYPKLIYYNRLPKGGHFAAWEQPQLFAEEMRASFKSLR